MFTVRMLGITFTLAALLPIAGSAEAQIKGTGKSGITIIRWDDVANAPVSAKAAGQIQVKPKAGTALVPTGGTSNTLKLPFQAGPAIDPAKPGFPAGDYVLQIETSSTATGDVDVSSFVTLTMSAGGKCTVHVNPTVDGDPGDWCSQPGNGACVTEATDKCTFSTYMVAGSLLPLAPGAGQPSGSRIRIRKKIPAGNCLTGDLNQVGTEIRPNNAGAFDLVNHDCADGAVVGVVGIANGDTGL